MSNLRQAAIDVIERWDDPRWRDQPSTARYMEDLRAALEAPEQEPVACGYDETTGNCTSNPCCSAAPCDQQALEQNTALDAACAKIEAERDALMQAAKLALDALVAESRTTESNVTLARILTAIAALKKAGV